MVSISNEGERMRTDPTFDSYRYENVLLNSDTSVLVPPMSKAMSLSMPESLPETAAPTTPPAGPLSKLSFGKIAVR